MSNQNDKVFAKGIYFFKSEQAPYWVVGNMSIHADEAIAFINEHKNSEGKLRLSIKTAKSGKHYVELDTYQSPNQGQAQADKPVHEQMNPDISNVSNPFENNTKTDPFAGGEDDLPFYF